MNGRKSIKARASPASWGSERFAYTSFLDHYSPDAENVQRQDEFRNRILQKKKKQTIGVEKIMFRILGKLEFQRVYSTKRKAVNMLY